MLACLRAGMTYEPNKQRILAGGLVSLLVVFWLAGCHWAMPRVDNAFANLRVDVVKNDAPNYTVFVRNNSPDHLQVVVLVTASKSWSPGKSHEERFVLEPGGQTSFPIP